MTKWLLYLAVFVIGVWIFRERKLRQLPKPGSQTMVSLLNGALDQMGEENKRISIVRRRNSTKIFGPTFYIDVHNHEEDHTDGAAIRKILFCFRDFRPTTIWSVETDFGELQLELYYAGEPFGRVCNDVEWSNLKHFIAVIDSMLSRQ